MSEVQSTNRKQAPPPDVAAVPPRKGNGRAGGARAQQKPLNHVIYARPLPISTVPLPAFQPHSPVSWLHLAYVWLSSILTAPKEPSVRYHGVWDPATRSVHVTDPASVRGLWVSGFYGKGTLSRSEPNWKSRELNRRGEAQRKVIEQYTESRRGDRQKMKWERARSELEAIEKTKADEQAAAERANMVHSQQCQLAAPVGPEELLALPNSEADILASRSVSVQDSSVLNSLDGMTLPPLSRLRDANPLASLINGVGHVSEQKGSLWPNGLETAAQSHAEGRPATPPTKDSHEQVKLKRQKSVRFSAEVESTTFQILDPPSPPKFLRQDQGAASNAAPESTVVTGTHANGVHFIPAQARNENLSVPNEIPDKEHLQLSMEEVFFLTFALGVLSVLDPTRQRELSTLEIFTLSRSHCFIPPKSACSSSLRSDDPFLYHYIVYHHFRSLGWVVRHGIKFGADWLLYRRGPVFDHAEFALVVIPSRSHADWASHQYDRASMPWSTHMGTVRVQSHALKSLVLVYVDIPPPGLFDSVMQDPKAGIAAALKLFKVQTVNTRRWSSNRNR